MEESEMYICKHVHLYQSIREKAGFISIIIFFILHILDVYKYGHGKGHEFPSVIR